MKRIFIIIGLYIVALSGYSQTESPDTIYTQQLNEVVVKSEKPQIKGEDGMMIVDLPTIVKDKPVNNILEALGYLPGVVNNNGLIGLAGASDVTIILNGGIMEKFCNQTIKLLVRLSRMTEGEISIFENAKSFLPRSLMDAPI